MKLLLCLLLWLCVGAIGYSQIQEDDGRVIFLKTDSNGYYNGNLKRLLDGTDVAFPIVGQDPLIDATNAPDISAVDGLLGNWLNFPQFELNNNWSSIPVEIPASWPSAEEDAIVYPFTVPEGGYSNVKFNFGVDNGVYVWLDGKYLGGGRAPGLEMPVGEYSFELSYLEEGHHHLQVVREDAGGLQGYVFEASATPRGVIPQVLDSYINAGHEQRSMIQGIGVRFDRDVSSILEAKDLKVFNIDTGTEYDVSTAQLVFDPANFSATWMLNRATGSLLPDGNYIAWLETDQLVAGHSLASCGATRVPVDDFTFGFHQLAGDSDGDRDMDFKDTCAVRDAWLKNTAHADYRSYFDFDLNDSVAEQDRLKLEATYFTKLAAKPALHAYLRNDTGDSQSDNRSSVYDIAVGLVNIPADVKIEARLDGRPYQDVSASELFPGKLVLSQESINTINAGVPGIGDHILDIRVSDEEDVQIVSTTMAFHYLGEINCPPYFTSNPPFGATLSGGVMKPVTFENWEVVNYDHPGDSHAQAEWVVSADGSEVIQRKNTDATFFLAPQEFKPNEISGSWLVNTRNDDDLMGFVLGYKSRTNFYLFGWSEGDENSTPGMTVRRVKTDGVDPEFNDFFSYVSTEKAEVLYSNNIPWQDFVQYEFELLQSDSEFRIRVYQGDTLLDEIVIKDARFEVGRFGFYNFSQGGVEYKGFTESDGPGLNYTAEAVDPEGKAVTYHLVNNTDGSAPPAGASIGEATGNLTWQPTSAGTFELTVEARDADGGVSQQAFVVQVLPVDLPPVVSIQASHADVPIDELVTLRVTATDDAAVSGVQLLLDGKAVELDANGFYKASFSDVGLRDFRAIATDSSGQTGQARAFVNVFDPVNPPVPGDGGGIGTPTDPADPTDQSVPVIAITAPIVDSSITYLTEVRGSIDPDGGMLKEWILDYAPASEISLAFLSDPSVAWTRIARGTDAKNDEFLGTFDPTSLRNDSFVIRLRAFNTNGKGYQLGGLYHVTGQAKLGNFRIEFTDLSVPLQGIPIQVRRIYDTLDSGRTNDFGYGWTLGANDADIRETVPDTGGGFSATPFKVGTRVYITTPEGRRVGFTFKLRNPRATFLFTDFEPYFEADPGVYEKLSLGDRDNIRVTQNSGGSVTLPLFGFGYNPDSYILTLQNGLQYAYIQQQGLKTITDTNGNVVTVTANGFEHSNGASITFERDSSGRISKINAPNSTNISYTYDAAGDLVGVTSQQGAETKFTYLASPSHYLETIANPEDAAQGRITQKILYDANNRVSHVEDGDGNVFARQNFDPSTFTGTRTDARGNVTQLLYNDRGNLLRETRPEGGITRYEYSDPANPDKETAIIDPNGNRREMTYDSRGNRLTEKDPLGNVSEFTYDNLSKITSLVRKDKAGNVFSSESAEYDAEGNLVKLINCAGDERTFTYDDQGRLVASLDFEGNLTRYDYTNGCPCGSPSKITYADGNTKLFEYNAYGQVTKVTDETGAITRFMYDSLGRQTAEIDHDGNSTTFEYDSNNNLVKRTDRLGRVSKFEYDSRNRLTREIKILTTDNDDSNDVIIRYEYDGDDRLAALIDPVGNRTEFEYDLDGRLSVRRDAAGKETRVSYDLAGNTATIIDRNGRKRSFLYDSRNLPTAERWHNSSDAIIRTIATSYDNLGRRVSITDPDSSYSYSYDVCSRVSMVSNTGTPLLPQVALNYAYDKDGRLVSVTDSDGVSVTMGYNSRGRSNQFVWQGGEIAPASVEINRNGRGQMTAIKRHSNARLSSLVSQTTFDDIAPQGWIKQIQHKDATGVLYNSGTNFRYSYDAEGQVIGQSSQGNSTTYSYDLTGQLTGADHTNEAVYPDEFYDYDKSGNRTSSHLHASYTTGTANRLQNDGTHSYSYDDEGNLTVKTEIATGATQTFAYDHRGRVTSIIERNGSAVTTKTLTFVYDALDRLIGRSEDGSIFYTLYHEENAWADYEASGAVKARYLFADRIDANLAKWTTGKGTEWYLADKLGSIRGLASAAGVLTESVGYDSFGRNRVGTQSLTGQRYGFTGREALEVGLLNYRSRTYSLSVGSFLQEDRIGFNGGDFNLSRYTLNSPLGLVDPTGEAPLSTYAAVNVAVLTAIGINVGVDVTCRLINGEGVTVGSVAVAARNGAVTGVAIGLVVPFVQVGVALGLPLYAEYGAVVFSASLSADLTAITVGECVGRALR